MNSYAPLSASIPVEGKRHGMGTEKATEGRLTYSMEVQ